LCLEQLQCQADLIDLLPAIEEANAISIALDKKVKFSALAVSPDARFLLFFNINFIPFLFFFQLKRRI
jgi:hypothetical protein